MAQIPFGSAKGGGLAITAQDGGQTHSFAMRLFEHLGQDSAGPAHRIEHDLARSAFSESGHPGSQGRAQEAGKCSNL